MTLYKLRKENVEILMSKTKSVSQGIVGCTPTNVPPWEIPKSLYKGPIQWVFMGCNPQECLENTVNTMGTLLGVQPIVP